MRAKDIIQTRKPKLKKLVKIVNSNSSYNNCVGYVERSYRNGDWMVYGLRIPGVKPNAKTSDGLYYFSDDFIQEVK